MKKIIFDDPNKIFAEVIIRWFQGTLDEDKLSFSGLLLAYTADCRLVRYSNRATSKMLGFNPIDGVSILPIYTANIGVPHLLAICCMLN